MSSLTLTAALVQCCLARTLRAAIFSYPTLREALQWSNHSGTVTGSATINPSPMSPPELLDAPSSNPLGDNLDVSLRRAVKDETPKNIHLLRSTAMQ